MNQFTIKDELYSFELERLAGFGKEGEKNFEGTVTDLQMGGYLLIRDFRRRRNKKGQPYGWPISVYVTLGNSVGLRAYLLRMNKKHDQSGKYFRTPTKEGAVVTSWRLMSEMTGRSWRFG